MDNHVPMIKKVTLGILLPLTIICFFSAQVTAQKRKVSTPANLGHAATDSLDVPVEKVHLHLDKPFYMSGDTVWFKAYLVNSSNNLTTTSKVLYVDLMNEASKIVSTIKVPLTAGLGWADIPLGKDIAGGKYYIRAYTSWMRNFDDSYFFEKPLLVSDVFSSQFVASANYTYVDNYLQIDLEYKDLLGVPLAVKSVNYTIPLRNKRKLSGKGITNNYGKLSLRLDTVDFGSSELLTTSLINERDTLNRSFAIPRPLRDFDVQFFPEGGELVTNIPSKIAFKATGSDGYGIDVSGYITDSANKKIADIKSEYAGMGTVAINPLQHETYTAHVKTNAGMEKKMLLPGAKLQGYVMTVNNEGRDIVVRIRASHQLLDNDILTLVVKSQGMVHGTSNTIVDKSSMLVRIPKGIFPNGIARITLLSGKVPAAERLVFINNDDDITISVSPEKNNYKTTENIKFDLQAKNTYGQPLLGSFSLAVVDESKVPYREEEETTILSNLLLTSELKGFIEKPNYYFANRDSLKKRHLDVLMMTQGWRKFKSREMPAEMRTPRFQAEAGLSVKGRVVSAFNVPQKNATVNLLIQDGNRGFVKTTTNDRGEFTFDSLYFENTTGLVLNAVNENGKSTVNIIVDSIPRHKTTSDERLIHGVDVAYVDSTIVSNSNDDYLNYLKRAADIHKMQVLNEVVVRAQRVRKVPNSANLNGRDTRYTFLEQEFMNNIALQDVIQSRVTGVSIITNKFGERQAVLARNMASISGPIPAQVFVDGIPYGTDLNMFSLNEFEAIEVLTETQELVLYGSSGNGGVILLTSRKSGPRARQVMGVVRAKQQGYAPERQFYSPKYNEPAATQEIVDTRSTIYWNPNIFTNSRESSFVSFFSAQKPGIYRFTVEGVDENGNLGRKVFTKEIK